MIQNIGDLIVYLLVLAVVLGSIAAARELWLKLRDIYRETRRNIWLNRDPPPRKRGVYRVRRLFCGSVIVCDALWDGVRWDVDDVIGWYEP